MRYLLQQGHRSCRLSGDRASVKSVSQSRVTTKPLYPDWLAPLAPGTVLI